MAEVTAEELMARVARRDQGALATLYDRHAGAALGLALRMLQDRSQAEEVVQEAFWRVWRRASTFDRARARFTTWLLTIVHHLAIDELRRRRKQPPRLELDAGETEALELPDDSSDVAEAAFAQVAREQVRSALAQLPPAQREVIELAYFQGLTHQEIAARLREPVGTVHTRARLGLIKIRNLLSAE